MAIDEKQQAEHIKSTLAIVQPYLESKNYKVTKSLNGNWWTVEKRVWDRNNYVVGNATKIIRGKLYFHPAGYWDTNHDWLMKLIEEAIVIGG